MFIVNAKEMYDIDHYTMEQIGLPGQLLMENAGREIFKNLLPLVDERDWIAIFIGAGNNGGDGFVIARYLLEAGFAVLVYQVVPDEKIRGDAGMHKQIFLNSGGKVFTPDEKKMDEVIAFSDVVIDALFGIGIKGDIREPFASAIKKINAANATVISVDIPSGLPADEGVPVDMAVRADYTFTVGAAKMTAFLPETKEYYGKWQVVDIGFSKRTMEKFTKRMLYGIEQVRATLPKRTPHAHKGMHGKGLIIGGSRTMPGAITMATRAALVAGSGLITAATLKEIIPIVATHIPEAMFQALNEEDGALVADERLSFQDCDAVAIGVGMGRNIKTGEIVKKVLDEASCPVIIDADGLYHLQNMLPTLKARSGTTIITPHAGEMARLLGIPLEKLLQEPFRYSRDFAETYGVYVVLKGKDTIIASPDGEQVVDTSGNPGLAKGGSGDVLTGIMTAMVMQNQPIFSAICNACYIHGTSADLAVERKHSVYDLVATDIIEWLPAVYRMISC